jgi:hypothetical protein
MQNVTNPVGLPFTYFMVALYPKLQILDVSVLSLWVSTYLNFLTTNVWRDMETQRVFLCEVNCKINTALQNQHYFVPTAEHIMRMRAAKRSYVNYRLFHSRVSVCVSTKAIPRLLHTPT